MILLCTITFLISFFSLGYATSYQIEQVTETPKIRVHPGINNKGEIVWEERDSDDVMQIYSNKRGKITSNNHDKYYPDINNDEEIVWEEPSYNYVVSNKKGIIYSGAAHLQGASINNNGEIIWGEIYYENNEQYFRISSNEQGTLKKSDNIRYRFPDINKNGIYAWSQIQVNDDSEDWHIYSSDNNKISKDAYYNRNLDPSINNNNEIFWINADNNIDSNQRGKIIPRAGNIWGLDANDKGTIVWAETTGRNSNDRQIFKATPNPVPEPTTWLLFATGLLGLAGMGRKKFFSQS